MPTLCKNISFLTLSSFVLLFLTSSCCLFPTILEVEQSSLKKLVNKPQSKFDASTTLYIDHSTCFIDAYPPQKLNVWNTIFPSLTEQVSDLVLIKGDQLEEKKISGPTVLAPILQAITADIHFADIEKALEKITSSNKQAVLITDFEAFDKKQRSSSGSFDRVPYLGKYLKDWIAKGNTVYFISEPYKEGFSEKKRFYVIFTNDNLIEPISKKLLAKINTLLSQRNCSLYKITNSDFEFIKVTDKISIDGLDYTVEGNTKDGFILLNIEHSVEDIINEINRENKPVPIIKEISFQQGNNYEIKKLELRATNVTLQYLSLTDNQMKIAKTDISSAFTLDQKSIAEGKIKVLLNQENIFKEGFLYEKSCFEGNLFRLDFVVKETEIKNYNISDFEWNSLYISGQKAICVSESIKTLLDDINPAKTNQILFTVFIKIL